MCSTPWPKGGVVVDYMHWQPEQVSLGGPLLLLVHLKLFSVFSIPH